MAKRYWNKPNVLKNNYLKVLHIYERTSEPLTARQQRRLEKKKARKGVKNG